MTTALGATALTQQLNDAETIDYLNVLHRVKPKLSAQLHAEAETAISNGASDDELALMVMTAYDADIETDFTALMQAEVADIEKLLALMQNGVRTLSAHAPKYCRLSAFAALEDSDPDRIAEEIASLANYGSRGYDWIVRFNMATLQAIESGRNAPNKYGRMNAQDEQALQNLMLRLMTGQHVSQWMRLQTASEAEQRRAMMTMNMCDAASEVLDAVNSLPSGTKGRLMGELKRISADGLLDAGGMGMFGGF